MLTYEVLMRVLVLGIDGYIGWALALRLVSKNHEVYGMDNLSTRKAVEEIGSDSAFPLPAPEDRVNAVKKYLDADIKFYPLGQVKEKQNLNRFLLLLS
jgi:nucleoside-diphosphate-sugar epimerase